jgi:hypothetical protein
MVTELPPTIAPIAGLTEVTVGSPATSSVYVTFIVEGVGIDESVIVKVYV